MRYRRMPIEIESPEQLGYDTIAHNLSESSVADRSLDDLGLDLDLGKLTLCYGDHLGDPALREQIAAGGRGLHPDDVLVTPGAAAALFAISTSQLGPGDHAVVVRTNYATNIETPLAVGADVDFLDLRFEDGFRLDVDRLAGLLRRDTKLVSITVPHNPTGSMCTRGELADVIELVERCGATLLCDETYRDLTHAEPLPLAASLSDRAVSVASLSKAYGLPGLRVGWAVTRDAALRETLLAAKEQIVICGATLDEAIAAAVLADRDRILSPIRDLVADHLRRVADWVDGEDRVEWVRPEGGVVCFPRIRPDVPVDVDRFYDVLLDRHGTYVGPGHWFDADRRHFRIGFGWPSTADLDAGLTALSAALDDALLADARS
jgi:aspartate/methionine/tyrosine aminotransferase